MHQVAGALRLLGHDQASRGAEIVATQVAGFADAADGASQVAFEKVAASVVGFFVEGLQHPERASGCRPGARRVGWRIPRPRPGVTAQPPAAAASAQPAASAEAEPGTAVANVTDDGAAGAPPATEPILPSLEPSPEVAVPGAGHLRRSHAGRAWPAGGGAVCAMAGRPIGRGRADRHVAADARGGHAD